MISTVGPVLPVSEAPSPVPDTTAAIEPSAAPVLAQLTVTGAGTAGVSLRQAPGTGNRLNILADGALLTALGAEQEAAGRTWLQVTDADGTVGWVAKEFVVVSRAASPVVTPDSPRDDFIRYGKTFRANLAASDAADTALSAAFAQIETLGPDAVAPLARTGRETQRQLYDESVATKVPERGRPLLQQLQAILLSRIEVAEAIFDVSMVSNPSNRAALDRARTRAESALISFTVTFASLARDLNVNYDQDLQP
jgi:SH3-like domain-containing protein